MSHKKQKYPFSQSPPPFVARTTREQILYAALELIAEKGFDGFSANALLRRTKISKGSLYHHFKNLDDVCLSCYELIKVFNRPQLQVSDAADLKTFLLEFGKDTLTRTHSHQFHTLILFFTEKAMRNPVFQKCQRELIEDYQEMLTDMLMKYVSPKIDRSFVKDIAGFISVVMEGMSSHRVLFEDRQRMEAIWLLTVESIIGWVSEKRRK